MLINRKTCLNIVEIIKTLIPPNPGGKALNYNHSGLQLSARQVNLSKRAQT